MSLVAILFLRLPFGRRFQVLFVSVLLVAGLTGFFWRYAGFFQRGATSVGARFEYWRAALTITRENPLMGSGPGTFGRAYSAIKTPESEPTRLTHNDYLQQASDSGIPGLVLYGALMGGALLFTYPRLPRQGFPGKDPPGFFTGGNDSWQRYAVWLGLLGWSLQSMMEFGLYIPALAWPAFALMGWMLSSTAASCGADPAVSANPPMSRPTPVRSASP
jgi:O-antigen ligase